MKTYRSRPVIVEAVRLTQHNRREVAKWAGGVAHPDAVTIPTLEGVLVASLGDWVVRGTHGEFYPVKDRVFRVRYEEV